MKKNFLVWMLLFSIPATLCAQNNTSDKAFEVPSNISINRRYYISLDKGNKMMMELTDINDIKAIANIDSLLQKFFDDLAPLRDSLNDPLSSKRIDYVTDAQNRKKIRLQQHQPKGTSYLVENGDVSLLRIEQDTVNIIGVIPNPPKANQKISLKNARYYHLAFYLNDLAELTHYMDGYISKKLQTILNADRDRWKLLLGTGSYYLIKDTTIVSDKPAGFTSAGTGDFLYGFITVNAQNYKNYFVPSFSLGFNLALSNRDRTFKWQPGIYWEPHYLFAKDASGKLQTYRNDFINFSYAQGGTKDHDPRKDFSFSTNLSLGYLIKQRGDFFDKNTFRFGAGKLVFYKTSIEPGMYFSNFFHNASPCIRITQTF